MGSDNWLKDILACPVCKRKVVCDADSFKCIGCQREYSLLDGVPVMLSIRSEEMIQRTLERSPFNRVSTKDKVSSIPGVRGKFLRGLFSPPSPSYTRRFGERIGNTFNQELSKGCRLLFVGGMRKTDVKRFPDYTVVNLDIKPNRDVDVAADGHLLPFLPGVFDGVVAQAVLEHVNDPSQVVSEIRRVLKLGGVVYANVPFIQSYHYGPLDFRRYTVTGLEELFSRHGFSCIKSGVGGGPATAFVWICRDFLASFAERPAARETIQTLAQWILFPLKYLDSFLARKPGAFYMAASSYYIGKRDT